MHSSAPNHTNRVSGQQDYVDGNSASEGSASTKGADDLLLVSHPVKINSTEIWFNGWLGEIGIQASMFFKICCRVTCIETAYRFLLVHMAWLRTSQHLLVRWTFTPAALSWQYPISFKFLYRAKNQIAALYFVGGVRVTFSTGIAAGGNLAYWYVTSCSPSPSRWY